MQRKQVKAGTTSWSTDIFIRNSATGQGLTGLVYNTANLTAYFHRPGAASVAIALATLAAVDSAWSSGGFKEIDSVNMKGYYRFDAPNALIAAGVSDASLMLRGATDMADTAVQIDLPTAIDQDVLTAVAGLDTKLGTMGATPVFGLLNGITVYTQGTSQQTTLWETNGIGLKASERIYHALIDVAVDGAADEYTVRFFKDMVRLTSGITSPTIQLVKRADGTDLLAETALTQIGSTGAYKYDAAGAARLTAGEAALAVIRATIDASTRTMERVVSRDA